MAAVITGDLLLRHFAGRFRWGVRDCSTAACDAFAELWGVDPLAPFRGYRTRAEARALIERHGGEMALVLRMANAAGLTWRLRGRQGDLALVRVCDGLALGLAIGDGRFAAKGPCGIAWPSRAPHGCWGMP